ncbi:MAG: carboxypeptidase regulatory-like domain-containing protein, partial [Myxococcales bacterium]
MVRYENALVDVFDGPEPAALDAHKVARMPAEAWGRASAPEDEQIVTASDARGLFVIDGLAPGTWELTASAPGFAFTRTRLKVPATDAVVELKASGTLEGFVVGPDGKPAEGAEVSALGGENQPPLSGTGPAGGFSLEVAPGTYRITARLGSLASSAGPFAVAAGQTVRGVRLVLGPSAAVEGTVTASVDGSPVEGASVAISPFREAGDLGRAVTDAQGFYRVEGLAPGSLDVVVWADGYAEQMRRGVTTLAGQSARLDFSLAGSGILEGEVTDGRGRPVPRALVRATTSDALNRPSMEARTDEAGRYRLWPVEAGSVRVAARASDEAPWLSRLVDVREGAVTRADFRLESAAILTGTLRAEGGGRLKAPALVRAVPKQAGVGAVAQAETSADGTFRFEAHA